MKKIIPILLVGVLFFSGFGIVAGHEKQEMQIISESIDITTPIIENYGEYISIDFIESTSHTMGKGKPDLPIVTTSYTFPLGVHIENIEVTFTDTYTQAISKEIQPAPIPQYISTELLKKTEKKNNVYSKENCYPEHRFTYSIGAGLYHNEHVIIVSIHLCPVQYHPYENILYISEGVDIKISYRQGNKPIFQGDTYDLLILAPTDFSDELQPLVDYKNNHEIATKLVTLEDIPSQGVDIQEDIKYFIKDKFEEWGITYVLLIGNGVEGEEIFPVRNAWVSSGEYENYFPSDLYYADFYDSNLDFSDWDANDNGKYAEFPLDNSAVDMYPDVYLGRLPCNDESEVTNVVNKLINFMEHNSVMEKIVQIGGDTFPGDPEGIYEGEFCNDVVMENLPGYTSEQLWGSNEQLTKINIIRAINKGVDFVDFSGHGSYLSWATHPPEDENIWIPADGRYSGFLYINIPWLFNTKKLPVVFLNACSCNKFSEAPNCLGWAFIQNTYGGAIASYGASGIGYGSYGSSEPERVFGWMEVNTFKGLYDDGILGNVWGNCISDYYTTFLYELEESDYKTLYEYALFGDPSLAIETGPDPESTDLSYQPKPLFNFLERFIHCFPILEKILTSLIIESLLNL
jgi:hypothetical protein